MFDLRMPLGVLFVCGFAAPAWAGGPPVPEPATATLFAAGAAVAGVAAGIRAWRSRDKH